MSGGIITRSDNRVVFLFLELKGVQKSPMIVVGGLGRVIELSPTKIRFLETQRDLKV